MPNVLNDIDAAFTELKKHVDSKIKLDNNCWDGAFNVQNKCTELFQSSTYG